MRTCLALPTYNRPHYLFRTVEALRRSPAATQLPVLAFLDDSPSWNENRNILRAAHFPNLTIISRGFRHGCDRNLIRLRQDVFEQYRYERMILVEDDVVISPHGPQLLERALDWAEARHPVGVLGGYRLCEMDLVAKRAARRALQIANDPWVFYIMPVSTWRLTRDVLLDYETRFLRDCCHVDLPHAEIWGYFASLLAKCPPPEGLRPEHLALQAALQRSVQDQTLATGQDACTMIALLVAGLYRLSLVVNRCQYIGAVGEHSTQAEFDAYGFARTTLDVLEEDAWEREFLL